MNRDEIGNLPGQQTRSVGISGRKGCRATLILVYQAHSWRSSLTNTMPRRFPFKFRIQAQPAALPKLISGPPPATKGLSATEAGPLSVRVLFSGMNSCWVCCTIPTHHYPSPSARAQSAYATWMRNLLAGACQLVSFPLHLLKERSAVHSVQDHEMLSGIVVSSLYKYFQLSESLVYIKPFTTHTILSSDASCIQNIKR